MGRKGKIGKHRKDKYYQLAKETGYRSRASFKLIQLNRKYEFLQKSHVLIDLCAAPGGWLQVATQHMPVSSIIVGVDLVPIKPIPNVITFEADITTSKCRQELKKQLQTWKADVVLNDGAPNVGKNWLHDAFQQAQLTLQALRLATEFLKSGGWFITKVFRSKDYNPLMWVFQQFFKKVYATKPQASRTESAEIFVVCQYYKAPDKIDPKLLDPKFVFEEIDPEPKVRLNVLFPEKQKKRAQGYADGETTMYHTVPVSEFIKSNSQIELLTSCSEIVFDDEKFSNHRLTTIEIKECCKDVKVLGRKELRLLLNWRKHLHEEFYPKTEKPTDEAKEENPEEEDEDANIQKQIATLETEQTQDLKRKKKKVLKDKRKLRDRMNLKMDLPNDEPLMSEDPSLFRLSSIKNRKQLAEVGKGDLEFLDKDREITGPSLDDDDDDEEMGSRKTPKYVSYDKHQKDNLDGLYSNSEDESDDDGLGSLHEETQLTVSKKKKILDEPSNPLVVDLDEGTSTDKKKRKIDLWFSKDTFEGLEDEADEDAEIDEIQNYFESKKSQKKGGKKKPESPPERDDDVDEEASESDTDDSDDDAVDKKQASEATGETPSVAVSKKKKPKKKQLDIEGLALGTMMIYSKKAKRDILDAGWNRYTFGDENLPDWFVNDEEKHSKKQVPVTREMVEEYKQRLKEINSRSIGKVTEAKARKKRKALKKLEKARKRAETITDSLELSSKEKMQQIKTIYQKAGVGKKTQKEISYVVAKKGLVGKRAQRPSGIKGPFRVVDPRMKKDNKKRKTMEKTARKKGKAKGTTKNRSKQ